MKAIGQLLLAPSPLILAAIAMKDRQLYPVFSFDSHLLRSTAGMESDLTSAAIVILTSTRDIHADRVTKILTDLGQPPFRINLDQFPSEYDLAWTLGDRGWIGELFCTSTKNTLDIAGIKSVWMRKPADFSFSAQLSLQEKTFADGEVNHLLLGWLNSLNCYFMSHPNALRASGWKCEQLIRAQRLGFEVPASMVTDRPYCAKSFIEHGLNGAIHKTLSTPTLAAEQVADGERLAAGLYTTMINADDPDIENIAVLPGLFQHYVEKEFEVRVTVVAGRAFAARIDSQSDERTRVDFRHYEADIEYSAIELPGEIAERCCNFVASYGLTYGAIDLIARPDGRYVFLENNPVGQFVFVEELAPELAITAAVADALIAAGR